MRGGKGGTFTVGPGPWRHLSSLRHCPRLTKYDVIFHSSMDICDKT